MKSNWRCLEKVQVKQEKKPFSKKKIGYELGLLISLELAQFFDPENVDKIMINCLTFPLFAALLKREIHDEIDSQSGNKKE